MASIGDQPQLDSLPTSAFPDEIYLEHLSTPPEEPRTLGIWLRVWEF